MCVVGLVGKFPEAQKERYKGLLRRKQTRSFSFPEKNGASASPPMATPPAATATNSAPTPPQPPYKAPPFSQPPSTAGAGKTETPTASTSTAAAAVVAAVAATGAAAEEPSYIITVPSYSGWFSYDSVSDTERRLMPEFFQGEAAASSGSRGPEAYKYYRDTLVKRFRARPERRLTLTEARRGLIGDIGSVRRVFDFLEEWGLINYGVSLPGVKQGRDKREEPVAPQSSLPAGVTAPKKLCIGCRTVCGQAYFTCEKADITICCRCYVRANYRPGLTPADFKKVETSEDAKSDWTDKETLHLLEAVLQYGEDWKKISEHVGSRSEKDCIARLLRLPFGEQFMGPKEDKMQFENDDVTDESRAEISKRVRLTPLADASNPIMAQVAFLSAIVGSDVATAAAQAAISAQSQVDETNDSPADSSIGSPKEEESCYTNGFSANDLLKEASANARVQLEKERKDIEQSLSDIVDVQMKEIQDKICRFEQKELLMEKERQQLHYLQKLLFADQLAVVQHQRRPHAVTAENKADEKPKPVLTS